MTDFPLVVDNAAARRRALASLVEVSERIWLISAWATTGDSAPWPIVTGASAKLERVVLGAAFGQTDIAAIAWFRDHPGLLRVIVQAEGTFHPKVVFGFGTDRVRVMLGSSNLTSGAYGPNTELDVVLDGPAERPDIRALVDFGERVWSSANEVDDEWLASYQLASSNVPPSISIKPVGSAPPSELQQAPTAAEREALQLVLVESGRADTDPPKSFQAPMVSHADKPFVSQAGLFEPDPESDPGDSGLRAAVEHLSGGGSTLAGVPSGKEPGHMWWLAGDASLLKVIAGRHDTLEQSVGWHADLQDVARRELTLARALETVRLFGTKLQYRQLDGTLDELEVDVGLSTWASDLPGLTWTEVINVSMPVWRDLAKSLDAALALDDAGPAQLRVSQGRASVVVEGSGIEHVFQLGAGELELDARLPDVVWRSGTESEGAVRVLAADAGDRGLIWIEAPTGAWLLPGMLDGVGLKPGRRATPQACRTRPVAKPFQRLIGAGLARASERSSVVTYEFANGWLQIVSDEGDLLVNLSVACALEDAWRRVHLAEEAGAVSPDLWRWKRDVVGAVSFATPPSASRIAAICEAIWGRAPTLRDLVAIDWRSSEGTVRREVRPVITSD